eukprot:3542064-Ditylum_brightwellii.AAC.1
MTVVGSKVVETRHSGIQRKEITGEVMMLLDTQAMAGHITAEQRLCFGVFCVIFNEKEDIGFVIGLWSKNAIGIDVQVVKRGRQFFAVE